MHAVPDSIDVSVHAIQHLAPNIACQCCCLLQRLATTTPENVLTGHLQLKKSNVKAYLTVVADCHRTSWAALQLACKSVIPHSRSRTDYFGITCWGAEKGGACKGSQSPSRCMTYLHILPALATSYAAQLNSQVAKHRQHVTGTTPVLTAS